MTGRERRIALVCIGLYPYSVGGAERFYGTLGAGLATVARVSHLTRTMWDGPATRRSGEVEHVGLTRWRRPCPPAGALFALALIRHLVLRGGRYEVVHCCCFPLVPLLAARLALLAHPSTALVADWHEVLTRAAWRRLNGRIGGDARYLAQRLAIRTADSAVTFSRMHAARLAAQGSRHIHVVPEFPPEAPSLADDGEPERESVIVFAGRLAPEKRAHLVPRVLAELRAHDPSWRAVIFGEGPEEERVRREVLALGLDDAVDMPGFAPWSEVSAAMRRARALVLPTAREGFGLVVLEAAAHGLPTVLVAGEDNAATELIEPGLNGRVVATADPGVLARATLALAADEDVHDSTRRWFAHAHRRYSVEAAVTAVDGVHRELREETAARRHRRRRGR